MNFLDNDNLIIMRQIITTHYKTPFHRGLNKDNSSSYLTMRLKSLSCIDDITIQILFADDVLKDLVFDGEGCAICISSTDILCDLLKEKTCSQAKVILKEYAAMLVNQEYDSEILEEAVVFKNVHKQQNRIKCASLGNELILKIINKKFKNV